MSGPYFYSACASKTFNGEQISVSTISKIALTGYISTPIFGPFAVNFLTEKGPKVGSIIAAVLYALGALSLCSNSLPILFVGRGLGGIGTSMISSAPEAWLVSEVKAKDKDSAGMWLPGIFGTAFQFDPIVAIFAGKLAGVFADQHGPTGPFQVSPFILGTAIVLILLFWSSTVSTPEKLSSKRAHPPKDKDTLRSILRDTVLKDTNILLVGCIQVLFESSMNVFLMLWPPTMNAAVISAYGESSVTPYGAIFSCMMASCAVGGLFFGELSRIIGFESMMLTVILCAMSSMVLAAYSVASHEPSSPGSDHLWRLVAAFLLFEACVGAYFPSIGVLRCNHFPDTNLSMIMTLFQLPTNSIVAVMFVFFQSLGNARAFLLTSVLLALGAASMFVLWLRERESHKMLAAQKVRVTGKQVLLAEQFQTAVREAKLEQRGLASRKEGGFLLVRGQSGMIQRSSLGMPI
jgi:MFS family permease